MTEQEFLLKLEHALKQFPADERNDILQDIREFFIIGREDGKTEEEIAASLGSPKEIAEELLASFPAETVPASHSDEEDTETIVIPSAVFSNVDMNVDHGSLIVLPSDSEDTIVQLQGKHHRLNLTAEIVGNTLKVRLKYPIQWGFMYNFRMKGVTLSVFIPKRLYDSVTMKTDNGRITAEKILGKTIQAESDNGRIMLKEIAASVLQAETDNGRIELERAQADSVKAVTDNGRIEMRFIDAETVFAESDNGRILLEYVEGNITGSTDNGRISLLTTSLDRMIDLKTDNGSISIQPDIAPANVTINAKTGHGRLDIFGEKNSKTVIGEGKNSINLRSDNGRITVAHPMRVASNDFGAGL